VIGAPNGPQTKPTTPKKAPPTSALENLNRSTEMMKQMQQRTNSVRSNRGLSTGDHDSNKANRKKNAQNMGTGSNSCKEVCHIF